MIDPFNCTKYDRTIGELQEFFLFCILVAGKRADITARNLQRFLDHLNGYYRFDSKYCLPFSLIRPLTFREIEEILKACGFGCYKNKSRSIKNAQQWLDFGYILESCSIEEIETVYGIGPKTSRFFILHSRKDANCVPLDTHALKFLRDNGIPAPVSTPQSKKKYKELEDIYISLCPSDKTLAQFDLEVWKRYTISKRI